MVSRFGTETSPSSGPSSATIMRKSVVFPAPFGPTRPTFSPGLSWKEASTKRTCRPYCLLTLENEIIEGSIVRAGRLRDGLKAVTYDPLRDLRTWESGDQREIDRTSGTRERLVS